MYYCEVCEKFYRESKFYDGKWGNEQVDKRACKPCQEKIDKATGEFNCLPIILREIDWHVLGNPNNDRWFKKYMMVGIDPDFIKKHSPPDIIEKLDKILDSC